jgi:cytochrome c peroxidase
MPVLKILILFVLSFYLFGCGGSSGSSSADAVVEPVTPALPDPEPALPAGPTALDAQLSIIIEQLGLAQSPLVSSGAPEASGELFELGKELFFSRSLSKEFDVACASCHHPLLAGGDGLSLSVGVDAIDPFLLGPGRTHNGIRLTDIRADGGPNVPRNAPTTFNIEFYDRTLFWDGRIEVLDSSQVSHGAGQAIRTPDSLFKLADPEAGNNLSEAQAKFPLTSNNEMFGHGPGQILTNGLKRWLILQRLRDAGLSQGDLPRSEWLQRFQLAFDDSSDNAANVITIDRIAQALSVYQRSQILIDNPWFKYVAGELDVISEEAKAGAVLFYSDIEQGGYACASCHQSNTFTDEDFHNLAIPQFGRGKNLLSFDIGRLSVTNAGSDKYRFRTPSLLNAEITGPWGHSGAYSNLQGIIRHHLDIEQAVASYDYSLTALSQFEYVPNKVSRYQDLTQRALTVLKSSEAWLEPSAEGVNELHLIQLELFLKTLTDPCAKDHECLATWIPKDETQDPDNMRLLAKFGSFEDQINTHEEEEEDGGDGGSDDLDTLFTDITDSAGLNYELPVSDLIDEIHLVTGGVSVADYDDDGWLDFFVSHSLQPGKLFRNLGNGSFAETTQILGPLNNRQLGSLFIDADEDGDMDLLLSEDVEDEGFSRLLINNGSAFTNSIAKSGISFSRFAHSFSMGDYDSDGDLDLYAAHWGGPKDDVNPGYLWQKQDSGLFVDSSQVLPPVPASPVAGIGNADVQFTANFADIDGDHDSDILLSGDFETSQVLINNSAVFQDVTTSEISDENGMGGSVGDYDNDGDLDWFVTSIWNPLDSKGYTGGETGNRLYNNNGSGIFTDKTDQAGVREGYWGWGSCFADFNNDGWLDIFHTNGMTDGRSITETSFPQFLDDPNRLFINNKDGSFSERSAELGIQHTAHGRGISCFDFDKDGDVDILIANNGLAPSLYRNNSAVIDGGYLSVQLVGEQKNKQAVGAKIWLESGDLNQYRELRLGSNYMSNDPVIAHFGLANMATVDKLTIRWPDGTLQVINDVAINQHLILEK